MVYISLIIFIKNKDKFLKSCAERDAIGEFCKRKTVNTAEEPKVDLSVYEWFRQERFQGPSITG